VAPVKREDFIRESARIDWRARLTASHLSTRVQENVCYDFA
jgi:hypothetical protein